MAVNEYRNIYMELRSRITRGVFEPETALPSEHLLCGEFQVSRPTIRRALGKLAEERLIIRRPGVGSFVAPPPEVEKRRKIIGLDAGSSVNCAYYYQLIFAGVSRVCEECGLRLQLLPRGGIGKISREEVCGVISTVADEADYPMLAAMTRAGIPIVLINRRAEEYPELFTLRVDYELESRRLVRHALNAGYRRIAVIGGEISRRVYGERTNGWVQAYREAGLEPETDWMLGTASANDVSSVCRFLREIRPEVAFVTGGEFINSLLMAVIAGGWRIPDSMKVLCFDDLGNYGERQSIPLGYVQMPLHRMGAVAVSCILDYRPGQPAVHQVFPASFVFTCADGLLL